MPEKAKTTTNKQLEPINESLQDAIEQLQQYSAELIIVAHGRGTRRIGDMNEAVKHLPGKHDQKTHGSRSGGLNMNSDFS